MNEPFYDIDLIERYFDNSLTEEETYQLKVRLKKDFEFQKLFDRERLLVNTIRFQAVQQNLNYLKDLEQALHPNKKNYFKEHWYYVAAAACVALIALAVLVRKGNDTPDALYTAYFKAHPNTFEPTLRGNGDVTSRAEAFQAYEQADYYRASLLFTKLNQEKMNPGILMLLGNSNLMLGKTEEAKQNFQNLIENFDELDLEAKWYLGLCYLRTGEVEHARNNFADVAATENPYATKAEELLRKLK